MIDRRLQGLGRRAPPVTEMGGRTSNSRGSLPGPTRKELNDRHHWRDSPSVQRSRERVPARGAPRCRVEESRWSSRYRVEESDHPALSALHEQGERRQTDWPKEVPRGTSCRSRSPKKPSERRTLVFALYEKSVTLAEGYSTCRLKAPSTAPLDSRQTGEEGPRHRVRRGRLRGGTLTLAGWSDAAYGDLSQNEKCRLGYLIGIMSSSLTGPCHVSHLTCQEQPGWGGLWLQ